MRLLLAAFLLLFPASALAQSLITGTVLSAHLGAPIAHARVEIPELRRELFTGPGGVFAIQQVPPGTYRVIARFLGYSPGEVTVHVVAGQRAAPVRIELARIPVQLTEVRVENMRECRSPGLRDGNASMQLAAVLSQMSENARRFRLTTAQYPFTYRMERSIRQRTLNGWHEPKIDTVSFEGDDGWRYAPGTLLMRREQRLHVPDIGHFADSAFIATHCFAYAGTDTLEGQPVARIDFLPGRSIRSPDVRGWIALDPQTYQIRGTVFNITNARAIGRTLDEIEVRTYFSDIAESLPMFSRVVSVQHHNPARLTFGGAVEVREEQRRIGVTFRGRAPASTATPPPRAPVPRPVETGAADSSGVSPLSRR